MRRINYHAQTSSHTPDYLRGSNGDSRPEPWCDTADPVAPLAALRPLPLVTDGRLAPGGRGGSQAEGGAR